MSKKEDIIHEDRDIECPLDEYYHKENTEILLDATE
jgi:hypothetical protein